MTRAQRIGVGAFAPVALIVAFAVLRPSADPSPPSTQPPASTPSAQQTTPAPAQQAATPAARPALAPLLTRGAVRRIELRKGEQVGVRARPPTADVLHVHGYDIERDVTPGATTSLSFRASIEGIFELEYETSKTKVAEVVVQP